MKAIIFKILAGIIACCGVVFSIIEKNPLACVGCLIGGLISYELAVIIAKLK